jgi:hypothetical protein
MLLIVAAAGFSFVSLNDSLDSIAMDMHGLAAQVNEIKIASQESAVAAKEVRDAVAAPPNYSSSFVRHDLDVTACKARGLEAIQKSGGTNLDVSQNATAWGTMRIAEGMPQYVVSAHCPEDKMVYILVAGQDSNIASGFSEKIRRAFLESL